MNDLSNYIREIWSPRMQRLATKSLVAKSICNFEFQDADGDTFHRPYMSDPSTGLYTRNATDIAGGAVVTSDITTTDETLVVNQIPYSAFFVDKADKKQMFYKAANGKLLERASYKVRDVIDIDVLGEYANAGIVVDDGDLGGTGGTAITLTTTNAIDVIEAFKAEMAENDNDNNGDYFIVVDPSNYYKVFEKAMTTTGYKNTDKTLANGFQGSLLDVKFYVSRNLTTATSVLHWVGGKEKAIEMVMQEDAVISEIENPSNADGSRRLGTEYISNSMYGVKTFTEGARELADIQIVA